MGKKWTPGYTEVVSDDPNNSRRVAASAVPLLVLALIAAFSTWFASSGRFPQFSSIQNDYVDLGDAFLHGQLALQEQPDPRLALLGNPYDFNQRGDIPVHWDASYYNGKYFLYWGPAPALVSAGLEALTGRRPAGPILVLIPYLGLLVVTYLLLRELLQAGSALREASIGAFLLIGFLSFPMLYTLGQPRHYQSSILFGQFFLMGGLLCLLRAMRSNRPAWLVPAGLGWGLALASRYNLVISIGIFLLGALVWIWRTRSSGTVLRRSAFLVAPIALCMIGLGVYNYARFGNPLETGLSYQLTIPELREMSYARAYIPSGLYVYGMYPLSGAAKFPFIQAWHFSPRNLPEWLYIPAGRQYDQVIFGLLDTAPGLWLAILTVPVMILLAFRGGGGGAGTRGQVPTGLIFAMLAAASAGQIIFLLVFFYLAERYIVDFYAPMVAALAIVLWWLDGMLMKLGGLRSMLWIITAVLALWTAAIGYFACFGVPTLVSASFDPGMVAAVTDFWNRYLPGAKVLISALP